MIASASTPVYWSAYVVLGFLFAFTAGLLAATGVALKGPISASDLLNPLSHIQLQIMKATLPVGFCFLLNITMFVDPHVSRWILALVVVLSLAVLFLSIVVGLKRGTPRPRVSETSDVPSYGERMHSLEDELLAGLPIDRVDRSRQRASRGNGAPVDQEQR
jgi:hypothetical protein